MATLDDLLNNFGLDDGNEGQEKIASDHENEQDLLASLLDTGIEKDASEGEGQMGSLAELYMQIAESDQVMDDFDKVASLAAETEYYDDGEEKLAAEKLAAEYDAAGRIMARGFMDEFNKIARELETGSQAATPALGERGTSYQMETNYEDKGPIVTNGVRNVNANALKAPNDSVDLGAENAMGSQFTTAKQLLTNRAGQVNAK